MAKRITLTSLWSTEPLPKENENKECSRTSEEEIQLTESQLRVDQTEITSSSEDECMNSQAKLQDSPTASSVERRFESGTIPTDTTEECQGEIS